MSLDTLRWEVAASNGKGTKIYFRQPGGTVVTVTPMALPPASKTLALSSQSLSIGCGSFFMTQKHPQTGLESSATGDLELVLDAGSHGCDPPPGPEDPPQEGDIYVDRFHHRDHLGSLRVVTDAAGNRIEGMDYYPFGMELVPDGESLGATSRMKYTGHERDENAGMDYMLARYYGISLCRFLGVDTVIGRTPNPQSWSRYTYVGSSPLAFVDPNGEDRYAILVGDPGLGPHNVGRNFERVADTRKASLEAAGHAADVTRVSTVADVNAAITSGDVIDGGVILISHGGVLVSPDGNETPAVFIGEGNGSDTNLTAANASQLSNTNLGPVATVELAACNSAGVAQAVANALGRSTTATVGYMSFSPDSQTPMSSEPGTSPPESGPLHLVPDLRSHRIIVEPEGPREEAR
ncbi:MAG: RHS repeat-associated core domain-containing protein [Acidobacteria bacterium]|nr:RHS repeat-associated core domain-containing protein [Acidobacteriota bacterium]